MCRCAPESINYLRFTSASDVWAYGVTLWEMFSYGFQPWAALTGQQILEAIDSPNLQVLAQAKVSHRAAFISPTIVSTNFSGWLLQRLEQPEHCPREYYTVMLKCWQHDANKRPSFENLLTLLPEVCNVHKKCEPFAKLSSFRVKSFSYNVTCQLWVWTRFEYWFNVQLCQIWT